MKRIGKYEIRGLLGKGGMGTVYKAAMPHTGKIVALKVCEPRQFLADLLGMDAIRQSFVREAVTMAKIRHPNIAQVWDCEARGERPFFVMEYYCNNVGAIINETYEVERPSRPLSVDAALRYTRQTLSALARLHHVGIIHMDVKPFNLMVTDEDVVKLIDFGLSKLRGERLGGPETVKRATPFYGAPEQEEDPNTADERADLYSAGVTFFRMLTGRLPLQGLKLAAPAADLDEAWNAFVNRACHREPEKRFPNAVAMLDALEALSRRWEETKEKTCALVEEPEGGAPPLRDAPRTLRSEPLKVAVRRAREIFGTDALWRPRTYAPDAFEGRPGGTIHDASTGLLWERSGSPYPVTWDEAHAYVHGLNTGGFAGRSDWRLPTVQEVMSLFRPNTLPGDFCFDPLFDSTKPRIWTADRKSYTAAWYADAALGFVWWQDFTCFFYARAVAAAEGMNVAHRTSRVEHRTR